MRLNKKKILVTGAAGFIGYHFCKSLVKKNIKFTAIDIVEINQKLKNNRNVNYIKKSIMDYKFLKEIISKHDVIFHFAGIAEPGRYLENPLEVINITLKPSLNIINLCEDTNKILFYTSTSEVYGKNPNLPFSEDDDRVLGPTSISRWCYSTAKSMVEHYLNATSMSKKLKFINVRLFNIYGTNLKGRVVDSFLNKALKNQDLEIYGSGKQTRSFLYVDDCIDAFHKILNNKKNYNKTFNVGNDKEISITALAKIIIRLTKSKSRIVYLDTKKKLGSNYEDIGRRIPNLIKIKKIGWKPKNSLHQGLSQTINNWNYFGN